MFCFDQNRNDLTVFRFDFSHDRTTKTIARKQKHNKILYTNPASHPMMIIIHIRGEYMRAQAYLSVCNIDFKDETGFRGFQVF